VGFITMIWSVAAESIPYKNSIL